MRSVTPAIPQCCPDSVWPTEVCIGGKREGEEIEYTSMVTVMHTLIIKQVAEEYFYIASKFIHLISYDK